MHNMIRAAVVATVALLACQFAGCLEEHTSTPAGMGQMYSTKSSGNLLLRTEQKQNLNVGARDLAYVVAVLFENHLRCVGAVVHASWVLTAGVCVMDKRDDERARIISSLSVRVGSRRALKCGQLLNVSEVVIHPHFHVKALHGNIALLKLQYKLKLGKKVQLIKIYEGYAEPPAESFITVGSWNASSTRSRLGRRGGKSYRSKIREEIGTPKCLMKAVMKIETRLNCKESLPTFMTTAMYGNFFFCALLLDKNFLIDFGASAVQNDALVGLRTTQNYRHSSEKNSVYFFKAYYYRDWVKNTISKADIS